MLWYLQMLCCCSHYVQPVAYLPRQSANRRSAGISKDYSSTSSTSLLYLQCFVQIHLIVHLIKLLYIIHFCFMGQTTGTFMYLRSNPLTMNIFLSLLTDTFLKTYLKIFSQPFYCLIHDPVNRLLADAKFFCNLVLVHTFIKVKLKDL